jgi:hypothetical protein
MGRLIPAGTGIDSYRRIPIWVAETEVEETEDDSMTAAAAPAGLTQEAKL